MHPETCATDDSNAWRQGKRICPRDTPGQSGTIAADDGTWRGREGRDDRWRDRRFSKTRAQDESCQDDWSPRPARANKFDAAQAGSVLFGYSVNVQRYRCRVGLGPRLSRLSARMGAPS